MDDGHSLAWSVEGARFELQVAGDKGRLCLPDGQLIDLTSLEWAGLAKAIGMVLGDSSSKPKVAVKAASTKPRGSNSGSRWTPDDDAELARQWRDQATIQELVKRFDRNEGGIESRLVHLKLAASRDDVRVEDEKRRDVRGPSGSSG